MLLPLLLVPVVSAVLVAFRPQLATAPLLSWRAFVATALVGLGGLLALVLLWRRSRVGAIWTADLVVLALMAAVVWPVFRERTVVEEFPPVVLAAPTAVAPATPSAAPPSPSARPSAKAPPPAVVPSRSATPSPSAVPRPSAVATRLVVGQLRGIDHHAEGGVALYRVGDQVRLRFEDVEIEGTPTPSVHLVDAGEETPEGGLRLGGLKGEKGSFSYAVPAGFDVADGWAVLVWCDRYAVPIAAADLA